MAELARAGLLEVRPGIGTVVAEGYAASPQERQALVTRAVDELLVEAARLVTDPPTVQAILLHLDLPHRPPSLAPARAPPQAELSFDQTPDIDPAESDPIPGPRSA